MIFDATVGARTVRVEVRAGREGRYTVLVDGSSLDVEYLELSPHFASLLLTQDGRVQSHDVGLARRAGGGFSVSLPAGELTVELQEAARGDAGTARKGPSGPARVTAPMPGRVVRVLAEAGTEVEAGTGLVVVEAMKMENELRSPRAGRVREVLVREGQAVENGALLVVVE